MTQQATQEPLYVGLAGMGTVGGGLIQLLQEDKDLMEFIQKREAAAQQAV